MVVYSRFRIQTQASELRGEMSIPRDHPATQGILIYKTNLKKYAGVSWIIASFLLVDHFETSHINQSGSLRSINFKIIKITLGTPSVLVIDGHPDRSSSITSILPFANPSSHSNRHDRDVASSPLHQLQLVKCPCHFRLVLTKTR